jgi:hypothetical protein
MISMSPLTSTVVVRKRLVDTLRRDLIGPGPQDADIARALLKNNPLVPRRLPRAGTRGYPGRRRKHRG